MIQKKLKEKSYSLNKKSDVYSIDILLWEISNGQPPFYVEGESYGGSLAMQIIQGLRETPVPDTPDDYVKLYTGKILKSLKLSLQLLLLLIYMFFLFIRQSKQQY